jgi:hypothetical protein
VFFNSSTTNPQALYIEKFFSGARKEKEVRDRSTLYIKKKNFTLRSERKKMVHDQYLLYIELSRILWSSALLHMGNGIALGDVRKV